jgi:hypothetical protein
MNAERALISKVATLGSPKAMQEIADLNPEHFAHDDCREKLHPNTLRS